MKFFKIFKINGYEESSGKRLKGETSKDAARRFAELYSKIKKKPIKNLTIRQISNQRIFNYRVEKTLENRETANGIEFKYVLKRGF